MRFTNHPCVENNTMKNIIAIGVALSLSVLAVNSTAKEPLAGSLNESLVLERGFTEISEGLYAKTTDSGESYVAQGEHGTLALRDRLVELRAESNARAKDEAPASTPYDRLIDELGQPDAANLSKGINNQYYAGDCYGPNTHHQVMEVNAFSASGLIAAAYANNTDSTIYTTNYAEAWTQNRGGHVTSQQSSTQYGTTIASANASTSGANACEAMAYASIKCPGFKRANLVAFHKSVTFVGCQN
jgi:hypothetical protein